MNEQLAWFVARASGIVALGISTLAVAWGLLFSTRLLQGRPSPKWLLDLHRFLGGLAVLFTAVHIAGLVADTYVTFGPIDLLVPFASSWKPEPVAWGVVAMYLLVAVEATSLVMKRMPRKWWRAVHFSSYAMFWLGIVHGARAGTDAGHLAYMAGSTAAVLLVVFLTGYRVLAVRKSRRGRGTGTRTSARTPGEARRPAPALESAGRA
jgi:DMSO/TMAO reductase YedYZ heme-binding membrane subunit